MANEKEIKVRHRVRPATATSPSTAPDDVPAAAQAPVEDGACAYEVGYGKPPVSTRFKSGKSGNSKGRPKGVKNLKTELTEELQERVRVREGGKTRTVSKQRAMLKRLSEKALQGDTKSASLIINMVARFLTPDEGDDATPELSPEDLAILDDFRARVRRTPNKE